MILLLQWTLVLAQVSQAAETAQTIAQMDPTEALVYVLVFLCFVLAGAIAYLYRQSQKIQDKYAGALADTATGIERFAGLSQRLLDGQATMLAAIKEAEREIRSRPHAP